ncbi:hypothetical protein DFH27DRAFT_556336 [Peziza echinospora]|nr:hypothetical protein DFH27DRAFT_556336 [Peziza echinospora]
MEFFIQKLQQRLGSSRFKTSMFPVQLLFLATFFLLLAPVEAKAFNRSDYKLPDALPKHKWVGKTNLNYTALHDDYVEIFMCLSVPVGVLGSFYWLTIMVQGVFPIARCVMIIVKEFDGDVRPPPSLKGVCGELFSLSFNIILLWQATQTLADCSTARGFQDLRPTYIMLAVASGFSLVAGVFKCLQGIEPAGVLYTLSLFLKYVAGSVMFFQVTVSSEILGKVLRHIDRVEFGSHVLTLLAWIAINFLLCTAFFISGKAFFGGEAPGPVGAVMMLYVAVGTFPNGYGNVLLGKIIGDPWGKYFLQTKWGNFSASMTGLAPVVELVLTLFSLP